MLLQTTIPCFPMRVATISPFKKKTKMKKKEGSFVRSPAFLGRGGTALLYSFFVTFGKEKKIIMT